jgi:hypothetical protein
VTADQLGERLLLALDREDGADLCEIVETYSQEERRAGADVAWSREMTSIRTSASTRSLYWAAVLPGRFAIESLCEVPFPVPPEAVRMTHALGRATPARVARHFVATNGSRGWPLVRELTRLGLIEAQDATLLANGVVSGMLRGERCIELVREEPALLDEIWTIFESSPGGRLAGWAETLRMLTDEGLLDRDRVLDATLDAQARDLLPRDAQVMAMAHDELSPTEVERAARLDRYLRLIPSHAPAVRDCGLRYALGLATPSQLAPAAAEALPYTIKRAAFALLDALDVPDADALGAVTSALTHGHTDVQTRAVAILERRLPELGKRPRAAVVARVRDTAALASPRAQARLVQLAGDARSVPTIPIPTRERQAPSAQVDLPFEPVGSLEEIVDLFVALEQARGDGIDLERLLDGLAKLRLDRSETFARATSVLRTSRSRSPLSSSLQTHLRTLRNAWLEGVPPREDRGWGVEQRGIEGLLWRRTCEAAARLATQDHAPLASTPTTRDGRIVGGARTAAAGPADLALADLRRVGSPPLEILFSYEAHHPWNRLRHARYDDRRHHELQAQGFEAELREHGDALYLGCRVVHTSVDPGHDQPPVLQEILTGRLTPLPDDRLGVSWILTAVPHHLDTLLAAFAVGVAGRVLESDDPPHWEEVIYRACDPSVALRSVAWHAASAALFAKPVSYRLAATELLLAASDSGRLASAVFGEALAFFGENELGKLGRTREHLAIWAERSDGAAVDAYDSLLVFTQHLTRLPRDVHHALGLAAELRTRLRAPAPAGSQRVALERLARLTSRSTATGKAIAALLEP